MDIIQRVKVKIIYDDIVNLDAMIEKELGKKAIKTENINGERVLTFSYANKRDAGPARFIVKKVPRGTTIRVEREK